MSSEENNQPNNQNAVKIVQLLSLSAIAIIGIIVYINWWPRYVILDDPPFPNGVFTSYEERSDLSWFSGQASSPSSSSKIWRKRFIVHIDECCEEWDSRDDIFTFLDDWLQEEKWETWEGTGSPCAHMMETGFLEQDKDFISYVPKGSKNIWDTPAVCVAVWPIYNDDSFYVLITTSNN